MTTKTRPPDAGDQSRPALRLIESGDLAQAQADEVVAPLEITVRPGTDVHGVALVLLAGRIGSDSAAKVRAVVEKLVRDHRRYILVDLDDVTLSAASSYEALVEATCAAIHTDATVLFTSDPRCVLMLKVEDPEP
jgi:anti-anti-sigma regulatory factor